METFHNIFLTLKMFWQIYIEYLILTYTVIFVMFFKNNPLVRYVKQASGSLYQCISHIGSITANNHKDLTNFMWSGMIILSPMAKCCKVNKFEITQILVPLWFPLPYPVCEGHSPALLIRAPFQTFSVVTVHLSITRTNYIFELWSVFVNITINARH